MLLIYLPNVKDYRIQLLVMRGSGASACSVNFNLSCSTSMTSPFSFSTVATVINPPSRLPTVPIYKTVPENNNSFFQNFYRHSPFYSYCLPLCLFYTEHKINLTQMSYMCSGSMICSILDSLYKNNFYSSRSSALLKQSEIFDNFYSYDKSLIYIQYI